VIQRDLPEVSRASAFGRNETGLQPSWVFGGVIGLLIGGVWTFPSASVYVVGFGVVTVLLGIGLAQCLLVRKGRTMVPRLPFLHRAKGPISGRPASPPGATPRSAAPGTSPVAPATPTPAAPPGRPPATAGPTGTARMPPATAARPAGSARPGKTPRKAGGKR
jgi:hypothetical protein